MKRLSLFSLCLMLCAVLCAQTGHFFSSDKFSSSLISDLCQDRQGYVWIATDYGLNRFDGYSFLPFFHNDADTTTLGANVVVSLFCDREGRLWVGTNRGLDRFEPATQSFVHYRFPGGVSPRVSTILQRRDGTLLFGTAGYGAYVLDVNGQLRQYTLPEANMFFSRVFEDSRGRLWKSGFDEVITMRDGQHVSNFRSDVGNPVGFAEIDDELLIVCNHGIMSYRNGRMSLSDIDLGVLGGKDVMFNRMGVSSNHIIYIGTRGRGVYRISESRPRHLEYVDVNVPEIDLRTSKVTTLMFDHRDNLWLGCFNKGVLFVPQRPAPYASWSFAAQGYRLGSNISSVCEGDDGTIWCTVQGVGVYGFNADGRLVAHPQAPDAVEFIFRDRQRRYWVGTDHGLFAYDPLTGQSQLQVSFECDKFNDMTSDSQGNIYISTFSRGFCVYNPQSRTLRNYNMESTDTLRGRLCNNWIMGMSADGRGRIWMATSAGVSCFDPSTGSFRSEGWHSLLPGIVCFDVCELHSGSLADGRQLAGSIAIATEQGLYLYDRAKRRADPFPGCEQLSDKAVSYIVQSNDGDIWCSTSAGMWQYSLKSQQLIGHVSGNGLDRKEYIYGVGLHTDADRIFFGHTDGLTVFSPADVKESHPLLDSLRLVSFYVGSQPVSAHTRINGVEVTDRAIDQSSYFTLSYLDHTITLAFSQFSFDNPSNLSFEYSVNGGQWISVTPGKNDFTLGHLQPGTYRIEVRALVGSDYTPSKVVVVTIRSPWYRSLTAYFIYFLLLSALGIYMLLTVRRRANRQLNEEKMKFLINATHDIRSPLTLIMGPLEKLKNARSDRFLSADDFQSFQSSVLKPSVDTIEHNAKRILNLVNQILDVRKIDKQQMQLHCQPTELVTFVSGICKMFQFNAGERNIRFSFQHDGLDRLEAWVDPGQFDKVVTNLLSNAFKYTADDGEVQVRLAESEGHVQLQVIDNGTGLDSDSLKHIFERFYQGSNSYRMHVNGTGIGLNLCKMIVDMHHGTIDVQNRTDTRGAVFTVRLPLGTEHLTPEEMVTPQETVRPVVAKSASAASGNSRVRVLVVDDDVEIGRYISTELGRYYKFTLRGNGKEGLQELLTGGDYDVVISDVMMPEMDGFTMLRMIKTNLNISDIPVIMLTSKADVGNRLEGLENGADAFLAKPFNMEELHMVIENLLQTRQRLRGKYSGAQQQADKLEMPEVKGNDEQLMERIMKAVNKNLSDSDFNVEMLTQEVGISRAQLHRKMKELTGLSTSEFIRNIRLEQAARLLKEQKINVTQVAYTVGFSNLAHFSTIFRKHFGVAPSEYAAKE